MTSSIRRRLTTAGTVSFELEATFFIVVYFRFIVNPQVFALLSGDFWLFWFRNHSKDVFRWAPSPSASTPSPTAAT
jgi:hypothetical protein